MAFNVPDFDLNHGRGSYCGRPSTTDTMVAVALYWLGNRRIWRRADRNSDILSFEVHGTAPYCIVGVLKVDLSPLFADISNNKGVLQYVWLEVMHFHSVGLSASFPTYLPVRFPNWLDGCTRQIRQKSK
jgi:hypothetical protein